MQDVESSGGVWLEPVVFFPCWLRLLNRHDNAVTLPATRPQTEGGLGWVRRSASKANGIESCGGSKTTAGEPSSRHDEIPILLAPR